MGDGRAYQFLVVIRDQRGPNDGGLARLPHGVLERIASRIVAEIPGVNRVLCDVSWKSPATIE